MDELHVPKSPALRALYWRSEILQLMFWLRGEGLGEVADLGLLQRFLGINSDEADEQLARLVDDGYLEVVGADYRLSAKGLAEGADDFAASFADLIRPAHGECSADCWCHASPDEAEACAEGRRAHVHQ